MTREEVERNIEKWREIARPFMDKKDKLNVRRDELLREMEQLQEDYIKALPVKIGDKNMDVLDYYEVVTSKIFKLESMNEGLVLIAPEQEVDGVRSLMVGLYVPEHERYKMYTFRSSMNEGELGDKYKAMVGTMDVLKPDWDRIKKKRRKRI